MGRDSQKFPPAASVVEGESTAIFIRALTRRSDEKRHVTAGVFGGGGRCGRAVKLVQQVVAKLGRRRMVTLVWDKCLGAMRLVERRVP